MNSPAYTSKYKFFIVSGENSGDLHASNLVRQMLQLCPEAEFWGLGGEQSRQAGVKLLHNIVDDLAVIGFVGVLTKYIPLRKVFYAAVDFLTKEKPDAVILIDYPGFNLKLMQFARELGIKVFYYISPQVWAWRRGRIRKIAKYVDKMLVILPFEEQLYKEAGVNVSYVGHPLLDIMNLTMTKQQVCDYFTLDPAKKLVGFLPGSRKSEVERHLPVMLEAGEMIQKKIPDVQFVMPRASTIKREMIDYYTRNSTITLKVVDQYRYNVRSAMDFAIVASGTATLETAFLCCPMIIIYKVSFLNYVLAKNFVRVPYIGLINIIAGNMLVPELLQNEATPLNLAEKTVEMMNDPDMLAALRYEMKKIKERMGGPGASRRAAEIILNFLNIPCATRSGT